MFACNDIFFFFFYPAKYFFLLFGITLKHVLITRLIYHILSIQQVLSTVSKVDFFQKLYPDDTLESSERRSTFLLDLYLNTPDKGLNETPLHFASKHGSLECVRILTSYPACNKGRRNKFGQTPSDVRLFLDFVDNEIGCLVISWIWFRMIIGIVTYYKYYTLSFLDHLFTCKQLDIEGQRGHPVSPWWAVLHPTLQGWWPLSPPWDRSSMVPNRGLAYKSPDTGPACGVIM